MIFCRHSRKPCLELPTESHLGNAPPLSPQGERIKIHKSLLCNDKRISIRNAFYDASSYQTITYGFSCVRPASPPRRGERGAKPSIVIFLPDFFTLTKVVPMPVRIDTPENPRLWRKDSEHGSANVSASLWMPLQRWYLPCKALFDFLVALVLLVLTAPVIFLAALAVKLTSPGPVFYLQTRVGKNGRLYTIYKLRTMHHNCELSSGACWSTRGDPRITPVGRFLRRTHVDELPQLWNVVRGDMCLVGPRPERPEFTAGLEQALPHYADRLLVRPGMTGLAQVQLGPDTDLESVRRKLAYDLYYVRGISPWLDLRILFCTVFYLFGLPFHLMPRLRMVPKPQIVVRAYHEATGQPIPLASVQPA
jgi:lipopolysaccharide/colanic/teichoic acid biosynthesis glycosyltransferase